EGRKAERRPDRGGLDAVALGGLSPPEAHAPGRRPRFREGGQGGLLLDRQAVPGEVAARRADVHPGAGVSQFSLLSERRFAPVFWTQFLGAANDNLFKFAFTLLATYHAAEWGGLAASSAGFVIAAIFIAPYVLFSATSGQIADKVEKGTLMRFVKNLEIAIMAIAAWGF